MEGGFFFMSSSNIEKIDQAKKILAEINKDTKILKQTSLVEACKDQIMETLRALNLLREMYEHVNSSRTK